MTDLFDEERVGLRRKRLVVLVSVLMHLTYALSRPINLSAFLYQLVGNGLAEDANDEFKIMHSKSRHRFFKANLTYYLSINLRL